MLSSIFTARGAKFCFERQPYVFVGKPVIGHQHGDQADHWENQRRFC